MWGVTSASGMHFRFYEEEEVEERGDVCTGPEQVEAMHGEINDGSSRKRGNEMRCKEMRRRWRRKKGRGGREEGRKEGKDEGGGVGSE